MVDEPNDPVISEPVVSDEEIEQETAEAEVLPWPVEYPLEEVEPAEESTEITEVVPIEEPLTEENPAEFRPLHSEVVIGNPKPTDICLTIETVDLYKRSDCRFYVKCLNRASIAGWQQFHCNDCNDYETLPEETRQNKTLLRLALLLEKVKDSEDFRHRNDDDHDD